ncbi:MtrB/PioB family outer membrane beta-barrel protein [Shewanella sp. MF05960]|uniref:MtrB/PioB family outer membrane beta-barrel protein n=1 Tax=Shewanella sp. MF05960 TaxID=3434874 RepID=UPI003D795C24
MTKLKQIFRSVIFYAPPFDEFSGPAEKKQPKDSALSTYKLDAMYRLGYGAKFFGVYQRLEEDRTFSIREKINENKFFSRFKFNPLAHYNVTLGTEWSRRDGSSFEAENLDLEGNPLLRKFNLADRERKPLSLKLAQYLFDDLGLDVNYHYSEDQYDDTENGLQDVTNNTFDVAINYQVSDKFNLHLLGGLQWVDSVQSGSQSFATADRTGAVKDEFSHYGIGANISGFMGDRLSAWLDYSYRESDLETTVTDQTKYGDYFPGLTMLPFMQHIN